MELLEIVFDSCVDILNIDMDFFGVYTFSFFDVLIVLVGLTVIYKAAFSFFRW